MRSKLVFTQQYPSYDSIKPYVVGTQKNCLTETILLSTNNIGFEGYSRIWGCEILFLSRALAHNVFNPFPHIDASAADNFLKT